MEEEIWKDIEGFEGYYQVSNLGRIKSLDRIIIYSNKGKHLHKGKLLKLDVNNKGYCNVALQKDGNIYYKFVHRLVAQAFIPNPNNYPIINHKDQNPLNNNIENLEWCTYEYNSNYSDCRQKISKALKGKEKTLEHRQKISQAKLVNHLIEKIKD